MKSCLCGCGGTPRRGTYLPGHDAKLDQEARRLVKKFSSEQLRKAQADLDPYVIRRRLELQRAIAFRQRPPRDSNRNAPFINTSSHGQAYDLAIREEGTSLAELKKLCEREGVQYHWLLRGLRRGRSKEYSWRWVEDKTTGTIRIVDASKYDAKDKFTTKEGDLVLVDLSPSRPPRK